MYYNCNFPFDQVGCSQARVGGDPPRHGGPDRGGGGEDPQDERGTEEAPAQHPGNLTRVSQFSSVVS